MLDIKVFEELIEFGLSGGVVHQFEGSQEVIHNSDDEAENSLQLLSGFVDIDHERLIMIGVVKSDENLH